MAEKPRKFTLARVKSRRQVPVALTRHRLHKRHIARNWRCATDGRRRDSLVLSDELRDKQLNPTHSFPQLPTVLAIARA